MNINSSTRIILYFITFLLLAYLLIGEYTYIHPYNTGYFLLGPKWEYTSTASPLWFFLLLCAVTLTTPLFRKQKIGWVGCALFAAVLIRPVIQFKFPNETALEFYKTRKPLFNEVIKQYANNNNDTLETTEIKILGFEKLIIIDSVYYFLIVDEEWPYGICYTDKDSLPNKQFNERLKYQHLEGNWYDFDY